MDSIAEIITEEAAKEFPGMSNPSKLSDEDVNRIAEALVEKAAEDIGVRDIMIGSVIGKGAIPLYGRETRKEPCACCLIDPEGSNAPENRMCTTKGAIGTLNDREERDWCSEIIEVADGRCERARTIREAAKECKEKYPEDTAKFFECYIPAFSAATKRGNPGTKYLVRLDPALATRSSEEKVFDYPEEALAHAETLKAKMLPGDVVHVREGIGFEYKVIYRYQEGSNPTEKKRRYHGPFLVNWQYGGYSYVEEDPDKPESQWVTSMVDFVNPDEAITIAEREGIAVISLAGGFWERVGYKGWGEKVSISEAKTALAKAREYMRAPKVA